MFYFEVEPVLKTPRYTVSKLRFPSPIETPDPANNVVHAEYFAPSVGPNRPAVIVLHILGQTFPCLATWRPGWLTAASQPCL